MLEGGGNVTVSPFPYACGCCVPGYTDTSSLLYVVTLTDAMRSSDVSLSRDRRHCLVTCHRFVYSVLFCYAYVFSLMLLARSGYVDLSHVPDYVTPVCLPNNSSLVLPVLLAPSLLPAVLSLVHLPNWTVFLPCTLMPLCTCIVLTCIYTGLEMGRSPSSIYFASTLKL